MDYNTPGHEDLELSTQLIIKEALFREYSVDVLDRKDNFIRISGKDRTEYFKQATKTRADSYISPLIMENKLVTKILLNEAGISTPQGKVYTSSDELLSAYALWKDKSFVIKPNSTNFGMGVAMFPAGAGSKEYRFAADAAIKEDSTVLVEELIPGKEYRFLVIGNHVRAVLHRVPANVTGDGISDIRSLIERKNENPLRQTGYISPLEKIRFNNEEKLFLESQEMSFESIPAEGEQVFLRKNSNISTGGDSIDFTDDVHPGYKDLAAAAARVAGARICGVDLIANDIDLPPDGKNYGIIELNFNPALHIHDFPSVGKNRRVEQHVLNLLGL